MKKNYNTNNPKATKTHLIHQVKHDTRNYQDSNSVITSATAIRLQRKLKRQEADKRREVSFAAEQESGWTEVLTMVEQQQINDARNKLRTTMHLNVKSSLLLSFLILFTNIVSVAGAQAGVTPRAIDNKKGDEIDPVTDVQASGTRVMNGPTIEVGLFADQVGNTKVNNIAGLKIKRDTSVPVVSAQRSAEVAPVNNPREKRAINPVKNQNCVNSGEILKYLVKILINTDVREGVFSIQKRSLASNTILGFRLGTRINIRVDNPILQRSRLSIYNSDASHSPCVVGNAQFNSSEIKRWQGSFVDAILNDDGLTAASRAGTGPIMVSTWRTHYSENYMHLLPLSQAEISSQNNLIIKKDGSVSSVLHDHASYFMSIFHHVCASKTINNIGLLYNELPSNGAVSGLKSRAIYGYCSNRSSNLANIFVHGATYNENGGFLLYEANQAYKGHDIISKLDLSDIELNLTGWRENLSVRLYDNSALPINTEIILAYSSGQWLRYGEMNNYMKDWRYQSGFASLKRAHHELYSNTSVIDLCDLQAVHASEQLFTTFDCPRPTLAPIATTSTHYTSTSLPAIAMQNTTALLTNETVAPDLSTESDINASLPAIAMQNTTALLTNETVAPDLSTESDIKASLPVINIQNTTISIAVACVLIGGLITAVCLIKRSCAKRNDNINDLAFVQVELSPLQSAEPASNTDNLNANDADRLEGSYVGRLLGAATSQEVTQSNNASFVLQVN